MKEMTLREICKKFNISRRAIQGYEKARLVSPTNKTEKGYLLYNDFATNRIAKIKLYQDMGFSIKEIQVIIDAPSEVLKPALIERKEKLESSIEHSNSMIVIIQNILKSL